MLPFITEKKVKVTNVPLRKADGFYDKRDLIIDELKESDLVKKEIDCTSKRIGFVSISGETIKKCLSDSAIDKSCDLTVHLSALYKLDTIISNSELVEVHQDRNKDKKTGKRSSKSGINPKTLVFRTYGAININGELYSIKCLLNCPYVDAYRMANKAHTFEVMEINVIKEDLASYLKETSKKRTEPTEVDSERNKQNTEKLTSLSSRLTVTHILIPLAKILKGLRKSGEDEGKLREEGRKGKYILDEMKEIEEIYAKVPEHLISWLIDFNDLLDERTKGIAQKARNEEMIKRESEKRERERNEEANAIKNENGEDQGNGPKGPPSGPKI